MAPLEVFVDRKNDFLWEVDGGKPIGEEKMPSKFSLNAGESLRVDHRDAFIQVRCSRKDNGGQIFLARKGDRIGIPNVNWGFDIEGPAIKEVNPKTTAELSRGSSADVMINGEVLVKVKHKPN